MKKRIVPTLVCIILIMGIYQPLTAQIVNNLNSGMEWVNKVGAIKIPSSKRIVSANKYGAINDTLQLSTKAIQAAIDDCAKRGGRYCYF